MGSDRIIIREHEDLRNPGTLKTELDFKFNLDLPELDQLTILEPKPKDETIHLSPSIVDVKRNRNALF